MPAAEGRCAPRHRRSRRHPPRPACAASGQSAAVAQPRRRAAHRRARSRRSSAQAAPGASPAKAASASPRRSSSTPPAPGPTRSRGSPGSQPLGLEPKRRTIITFDAPPGTDLERLPFAKTVGDELYFAPESGRLFASPMDEVPSEPCDAQPDEYEVALAAHRMEERTTVEVERIHSKLGGPPDLHARPSSGGRLRAAMPRASSGSPGRAGSGCRLRRRWRAIAASLIAGTPWPVADVAAEALSSRPLPPAGGIGRPSARRRVRTGARSATSTDVLSDRPRDRRRRSLQRHVEIDGQGRLKPERAHAADRVAGHFEGLLGTEHPRPGAELVLALAVVEPRVAAGARAGIDGRPRAPPASWRSARARRRAPSRRCRPSRCSPRPRSGEVGRMLRKPGADRLEAHSPIR